ncbi:MAG: insulinase family protein, partial [Candidatus Omnitrophica bacterium]|nr:insulinase family protein [Candidatus Omnitrophota bacterium]
GLTVLLTENHQLPLCAISISVKGGLRSESSEDNGISNFTAGAMLRGTGRYKKDEIVSIIESLGAQISPYSGNNSFGFSANFMKANFKDVSDLLAEILLNPSFPEEEVSMLKNDTLAAIGLIKDDIFQYANISLRKNLFKDHPYGFTAQGTEASVSGITKDKLAQFHKKYCVAKNIVISIWGDINTKDALDNIKNNFKNMAEGELYKPPVISIEPLSMRSQIIEPMQRNQSVVMIGYRSVSLYDKDRYPLEALSSLFSDGGGRLYSSIRQKEALAYTLGTFGMVGLDTGSFMFYAATTPNNAYHVKDAIMSEIKKVYDGEITDEEINAAKKILITNHQIKLQSNLGLAGQTALDELYGLGYNNYLSYPDRVNAVSKKDIVAAARKYFKTNGCVIVITMPENK